MEKKQKEHVIATYELIKKKSEGETSGHDLYHIDRVYETATYIGTKENADVYVVQLAALLHDIADFKFHYGDTKIGPRRAREFLATIKVGQDTITHVADIIEHMSFKGAGAETPMSTLEGRVVRDADRLDAMGAIGIARCFTYGGHKGRPIYDPSYNPQQHNTKEEYLKNQGSSLAHFDEKLLLLKDMMTTMTGKILAEKRHNFMQTYVDQFLSEWNCEDLSFDHPRNGIRLPKPPTPHR